MLKKYPPFEWRRAQSDTAVGNKNGSLNQQVIASCPPAVPSRTIWRRPLMVRQPYSVAVPSTGGRLHPLVPEEREDW